MKTSRFVSATISALCAISLAASLAAAELTANDKQFLGNYEKVRAALAADNLDAAKQAAGELGDQGTAIAKSDKIADARKDFEKLSDQAIQLSKGHDGYYVANCPMLKKDWVQTSKEISNPYAGKSMLTCGVIKK